LSQQFNIQLTGAQAKMLLGILAEINEEAAGTDTGERVFRLLKTCQNQVLSQIVIGSEAAMDRSHRTGVKR